MRYVVLILFLAVIGVIVWPGIRAGMRATKRTSEEINKEPENHEHDPPPPAA